MSVWYWPAESGELASMIRCRLIYTLHTEICCDYVWKIVMNLLKLMQTVFACVSVAYASLNLMDDVWKLSTVSSGCSRLYRWPFLGPAIINKVMWPVPDVIRDAVRIFYHSAFFIAEVRIMISGWNLRSSAACWFIGLQNIHHKWDPACWELSERRWRLKISHHLL